MMNLHLGFAREVVNVQCNSMLKSQNPCLYPEATGKFKAWSNHDTCCPCRPLTLADIAGAVFDKEAIACFSCFQKLAQESCRSSKRVGFTIFGAVQVCICQCITSWLLFQVRDKEGAKQDLQNHALAYKRRELQVGNFRFLCTSCDDATPCHV